MTSAANTTWTVPPWFLAVLILNLLVVDIYWLYRRLLPQAQADSYKLRCLVMLLCPVAGPVFFFFCWLYYRIFFRKPVDLDDVIFSKDRAKTLLMADEEHERNFVPLEEAIAVTDQANTRMLMIEIVRRDISNSLSTITLALGSDDSEVSHYAATVLQETLGKLRMNFQKLWRHIKALEDEVAAYDTEEYTLRLMSEPEADADTETASLNSGEDDEELPENAVAVAMYREEQRRQRNKEESYRQGLLARDGVPDPESQGIMEKLAEEMDDAHTLLDDLRQILWQKVLSDQEQKSYTDMMEDLARLIDRRDMLTAYELDALITALQQQGEYERCLKWCGRSDELYPNALTSYTCRLRVCYATGDREGFFRVLDELKKSDIPLDHETLEMVRVFL